MKHLLPIFRMHGKCNNNINKCRFFYVKAPPTSDSKNHAGSLKDKLVELSVRFTEGYTCFHLQKCICGINVNSFTTGCGVFINKRTGFFMCEKCRKTADWELYSDLLKKPKINIESINEYFVSYDNYVAEWFKVVKNSECLNRFTDKTCLEIFKNFHLGPFSRSVVENLDIRINLKKDTIYFPLSQSKYVVGYKTYHINGEESIFPKFDCPGVLKSSSLSNLKACVVVATLQDYLAISSAELNEYEVICLPYGGLYLPQSSLPYFERFNKIILWLNEKFIDAVGKIAEKFNEKRCYIVRPKENHISPSVALSKEQDILKILSEAKLSYNEFVTTFSSFKENILADLKNPKIYEGVTWERFPSLTKILKGHRRGEVTIITGPTGVGKTTFLSEYSLDLASQGVHTLWGSFEIKNTRLARMMLTQFARAPLPAEESKFNELCDMFEKLPFFFLTFHGQQDIFHVMDVIHHCTYIYDIAHVIIDNIQFMIQVSSDTSNLDRFNKQDLLIQMFRSFASKQNCHVTLVMHPKKTDNTEVSINSIFGGIKASQEADNIFIIQEKDPLYFRNVKELQVVKNRFSGDLGSFVLKFCKPALSFSENNTLNQQSEHLNAMEEKMENKSEISPLQ